MLLAEEKGIREWDYVCSLEATIINHAPFREGPAVRPAKLHPIRRGQDVRMTKEEYAAAWEARQKGR